MSKQVPWNKLIVEEFVTLADLTETEEHILRTRVRGYTRVQQSEMFGMSLSSVDRVIATLKRKYDAVQPYSVLLPPRKFSANELYMDTH